LRYAYYNTTSPAAFSGINELYKFAKKHQKSITRKQVKVWLEKQNVYTLHKPVKRRLPRNRVVATGMDTDWQADLCDMKAVSKHNKGIQYLLTVIDVLSKFAWVVPTLDKTAAAVAKAFEKILSSTTRKPWRLYTDKGKEFVGKPFQEMLRVHDIKHIGAKMDDTKAAVVERYNRTLKTRLWRYFTQQQTFAYLKTLPRIVAGINKSYHRSIKRRPVDVSLRNENDVWETLYGKEKKKPVKFRFSNGARVRITRYKHIFEKGYVPNFSKEVFTVTKQIARQPPVYELTDDNQEVIDGLFYEHELVPFEGKQPTARRKKTRPLPMLKKRRRT